ncbi:MAG: glutamate decarboxylase, partial [Firmicutes bacterium]|nr:glutamate decarboxylase [Bacillota bacterium]
MLHRKQTAHLHLNNNVFASSDLTACMPKYRLPQTAHDPREVYALLSNELLLDGNARQNLATFCSTWEEPEVHRLMDNSLGKNMIDKDEYPQTTAFEERVVHMLADLWHSPQAAQTIGTSTTGSSEAAMLGGLAMKWRWRQALLSQHKTPGIPNLVTGPVQVCWEKFARYFDVELRQVPLNPGQYVMNPEDAAAACDDNTIGVVATLGTTFTGHYEPVAALSQTLDALQKTTGRDIPIHVDAASGGFFAPFVDPDILWDFQLPRVRSINASGHKFGLAPLGVGWIIWREQQDLPEELIFNVNYLGGEMPTFALNFSRPGGQVIAQYYNLLRLGRDGYTAIAQDNRATAAFLTEKIRQKSDLFTIVHSGHDELPIVTWTFNPHSRPGFTLFDLSHELRTRGWQVPAYTLVPHLEHLAVLRIVVRRGFTRDMAELLWQDLSEIIEK